MAIFPPSMQEFLFVNSNGAFVILSYYPFTGATATFTAEDI